ncbi:Hypothetical protein, putative [Bodo saltans]|uniref:Uncharacterized protein n=1 Tax=Bodo saltans TaxID=75058 RepID=A0A0S4J8P3_BODSA|nr:Hypothetical protein, putative [Bodo saltans]|eukprot:CUG85740.1 Hypothetical protein, putative [Bodo saltans]
MQCATCWRARAAAVPLDGITDVPVAAHLCCTYNAGGMIAEAAKKFDVIRKYRRHTHKHSYEMEDDEWAETSEVLHQLSDDYCHQDDEEDASRVFFLLPCHLT